MIKSLGVAVIAVVIYFYPHLAYIDAIYTIVVSIVIIVATVSLVKECIHELLGGVPEGFELKEFRHALKEI